MRKVILFPAALFFLAVASPAQALPVRDYIEQAVRLIDRGQPVFARTFLDPALISPLLHSSERSRAYYLRGYSFLEQHLYRSARLDFNRALEFNPDNPAALLALGRLHQAGQGGEQNPRLAYLLFEKAARLGLPDGQVMLGRALLFGDGVAKDLWAARRWFGEAAAAGSANAMLHMAVSYRTPYTDEPFAHNARRWYEKAEAAGSTDALIALGEMHARGEFGAANAGRAVAYYRQAAEKGAAEGQVRLAHAYLRGSGVRRDQQLARQWFARAGAQGSVAGWLGLGYLAEAGIGQPADAMQALDWYRKAALAGDAEGIRRVVGVLIERGTETSHREAVAWLSRLAREGDGKAANDCAWLLATSPHDSVRDGRQAISFAAQAVAVSRTPDRLDTLAAAYAEAGRFDAAVATELEALGLVTAAYEHNRAGMSRRLRAYEAGRPWRQ
ncbi:MAG: SEL1-like repeat protein [Pseudomonadales bacterium]|nr:SEL1-like repeat protein [Pseudomonadales bacterium]